MFPGLKFFFVDGDYYTHRQMLDKVSRLSSGAAIILGVWLKDANNEYLSPKESYRNISNAASAPVFCFVRSYVGLGPVGGNVFSGYMYGAKTAETALKILRGHPPPVFLWRRSREANQFSTIASLNAGILPIKPRKGAF